MPRGEGDSRLIDPPISDFTVARGHARPTHFIPSCPLDPAPPARQQAAAGISTGRSLIQVLLLMLVLPPMPQAMGALRAGAFAVDISPTNFPVRVNAMFTERSAERVVDPLYAKALALEEDSTRMILCVVDSCMIPRELIDEAKAEANRRTGIPTDRMLVSATHTHSAPSAMGCLGSRVDPRYAAFLPARIAAAIAGAVDRLTPARIGWVQGDDWEHTFNRRWIRRPDRLLTDPFGESNVRAHMHPGHESPDALGPSGPVDPQLSVLALQRADGHPLALLANYSQHYYGSPLLSSDYYGRFAEHIRTLLGVDETFVGILSQGTSGDLMWMDYGAPRHEIGYDAYAREIAERVAAMMRGVRWRAGTTLRMAERTLPLAYRVPGEARLVWAREMASKLGDRLPQSQPEIYALEALLLHERPRTELKLQALRIGDLGITALPNEVFALTGLKLKRQSPLAATFNIELANGAEGYIPPPEQHRLGGYTTWPARTAGLETQAEPRIVEAALSLLEEVAGRGRRPLRVEHGPYARAVLRSRPLAYWRFEDMTPSTAMDSARGGRAAHIEGGAAYWLPGADGRVGFQPAQPPAPNAFSASSINRAIHLAGGRVRASLPLAHAHTVELWVWNALPDDAREVTGSLFSRAGAGESSGAGDHLAIGGSAAGVARGRLVLIDGETGTAWAAGKTALSLRTWHQVLFVREGDAIRVYLDGRPEPEILGSRPAPPPSVESIVFVGGSGRGRFNLEGKIDEVAVYPRALPASEIADHFRMSGLTSRAARNGTSTSPVAVARRP